ncbi:MAG: topoisomerase DNA-binding C4 zinc finger domain-containing protein [Oscillospiraceae bacterium]|nr:topoisomerase DNA-binding C4 zinc finger domain-containing protein [Oscillospiraceae bacterium]
MKISSDGFTSFIVFSERCSLKKVPPSSQKVVIVRRPDMLREIRVRLNNSTIIFSESEIRTMATQLSHLANRGNDEKQQHIKDIQTSCPFCGCELVLRNGKYGQFWGCSAYPKCRFTKQIEKGERK